MRLSRCLLALAFASVSVSALADSRLSLDNVVRYSKIVERLGGTGGTPSLEALEAAAAIYGQDGDLWWQLAQARLRNKDYDGSIQAYQQALKLGAFVNKFKATAQYDIACAYALKGDKEKAFDFLKQSMASGFRDLAHVRTDADLELLRQDKRWVDLAATKDVSKMGRDEGWRYDLWLLDREVRRIHLDPYRFHSKEDHEKWVRELHRSIPKLTDNQIRTAFMKYMRRIGDGHTSIRPPQGEALRTGVQFYWFEEGVFVTAAAEPFADLVGAELLAVGGKPVNEVLQALDQVTAQDNSQGLRATGPAYLAYPGVLHGLGFGADKAEVLYKFKDAKGVVREVAVPAAAGVEPKDTWISVRDTKGDQPLYLKNRSKPYWFEYLPDQKAVYFQYNSVRNDPTENTQKFADRLFEFIDKNEVERLIVDARWNGGGNSFLNRPIVNGIIGCKKINHAGKLFIVIGRNTFSAAQNFVTDLGRQCDAVFVGEPSGSSPNFVGESIRFGLPYSKMTGTISDLYWQRSWPMDHRTWIAPELPAPPTFEQFRSNRDPALEAIFAYFKAPA
jgi:tetratricopeptide (TPR) repeat protein